MQRVPNLHNTISSTNFVGHDALKIRDAQDGVDGVDSGKHVRPRTDPLVAHRGSTVPGAEDTDIRILEGFERDHADGALAARAQDVQRVDGHEIGGAAAAGAQDAGAGGDQLDVDGRDAPHAVLHGRSVRGYVDAQRRFCQAALLRD